MKIREEVHVLITKFFKVKKEDLTDNTLFVENLGADSLDVLEILMEVQEKFDIDVKDESISNIRTIGDLVSEIQKVI